MPEPKIPESLKKYAQIKKWEGRFKIHRTGENKEYRFNTSAEAKFICEFKGYYENITIDGLTGNFLWWEGIGKANIIVDDTSGLEMNWYLEQKNVPQTGQIWLEEKGEMKFWTYVDLPSPTKVTCTFGGVVNEGVDYYPAFSFIEGLYPFWTVNNFKFGELIERKGTAYCEFFTDKYPDYKLFHRNLELSLKPITKPTFIYEAHDDLDDEQKLQNVVLEIQHPDGSIQKHITDEKGRVTLEGEQDDVFILLNIEKDCCEDNYISIIDSKIQDISNA